MSRKYSVSVWTIIRIVISLGRRNELHREMQCEQKKSRKSNEWKNKLEREPDRIFWLLIWIFYFFAGIEFNATGSYVNSTIFFSTTPVMSCACEIDFWHISLVSAILLVHRLLSNWIRRKSRSTYFVITLIRVDWAVDCRTTVTQKSPISNEDKSNFSNVLRFNHFAMAQCCAKRSIEAVI